MEKLYLGIDPGKNGGIAVIGLGWYNAWKMPKTERDIWDIFDNITKQGKVEFALIERVHSMPKDAAKVAFSFGQNYGFLRACLVGHYIPFEEIAPGTWQRRLSCLTKGDKNITKAKAQQLFPELKITHSIADALLIAYYCKFYHNREVK